MPDSAPRRRRLRYRLSWLLVLLTLACLFLGRKAYLAREQGEATRLIGDAGGRIVYSYELDEKLGRAANPVNPYPVWLRSALGEEYFRTPMRIVLRGGGPLASSADPPIVTPEAIATVGNLRQLEWIDLSYNDAVDDVAVARLARLKHLDTLFLYNTQVTGTGFESLGGLPIDYLVLSESPVTDEGLRHVARLRQLTTLHISHTDVGDEGLAHLADHPKLEVLSVSSTNVSDAGLVHLEKLPTLKTLAIRSTRVTKAGVERLAQALPGCTIEQDYALEESP